MTQEEFEKQEQLNKFGWEVFRYVKQNFPAALTWPVRSRYRFTNVHEGTIMIIYERTFASKNEFMNPTDCLYIKEENVDDWLNHLYIDPNCKYKRVKDCKFI